MHPRYGQVCETALVLTNRVKSSNIIPLVPTGRLLWEKAANFGHGASVMRKVRITTLQLILLPQSSASAALTSINDASNVSVEDPLEPMSTTAETLVQRRAKVGPMDSDPRLIFRGKTESIFVSSYSPWPSGPWVGS